MELHDATLLHELKIDKNGISASGYVQGHFPWNTIAAVVGYRRRRLLGLYRCIAIAAQDASGSIAHLTVLATRGQWKYQYFLESIVRYMIDNHGALGGKTWCARPLDTEGHLLAENDLYRSYVLCRVLVERIGAAWFDHTQDDEESVALTLLGKRLARDGTEYKQVCDALEATRFPVQEDGSIDLFTSIGYRLLDAARAKASSKTAQQGNGADGC